MSDRFRYTKAARMYTPVMGRTAIRTPKRTAYIKTINVMPADAFSLLPIVTAPAKMVIQPSAMSATRSQRLWALLTRKRLLLNVPENGIVFVAIRLTRPMSLRRAMTQTDCLRRWPRHLYYPAQRAGAKCEQVQCYWHCHLLRPSVALRSPLRPWPWGQAHRR